MGGVKVRVGDTILDASLKTQLNRLKQSLSK
jgi:F0F1-type ATP synthase delta subunit